MAALLCMGGSVTADGYRHVRQPRVSVSQHAPHQTLLQRYPMLRLEHRLGPNNSHSSRAAVIACAEPGDVEPAEEGPTEEDSNLAASTPPEPSTLVPNEAALSKVEPGVGPSFDAEAATQKVKETKALARALGLTELFKRQDAFAKKWAVLQVFLYIFAAIVTFVFLLAVKANPSNIGAEFLHDLDSVGAQLKSFSVVASGASVVPAGTQALEAWVDLTEEWSAVQAAADGVASGEQLAAKEGTGAEE